MNEIELNFPFDSSAGSKFSLFKDFNNTMEAVTYKGKEYLVRDLIVGASGCTVTLYTYPTGRIIRASDWNELAVDPVGDTMTGTLIIAGNLCIYCGQEYREVKFRWNDERRVGCSKCGAPKGNL